MSALTRVVLQLGRNPQAGYPDGDRYEGYIINAPLGVDGKLDVELWKSHKKECFFERYSQNDEDDARGLLTHRGEKWFFSYDDGANIADEDLFRLGDHRLWVGDYVTIHDNDDQSLVYVVSQTGT